MAGFGAIDDIIDIVARGGRFSAPLDTVKADFNNVFDTAKPFEDAMRNGEIDAWLDDANARVDDLTNLESKRFLQAHLDDLKKVASRRALVTAVREATDNKGTSLTASEMRAILDKYPSAPDSTKDRLRKIAAPDVTTSPPPTAASASDPPRLVAKVGPPGTAADATMSIPPTKIQYSNDRTFLRQAGNLWMGFGNTIKNLRILESMDPTNQSRMHLALKRFHQWSRYQSKANLGQVAKSAKRVAEAFSSNPKQIEQALDTPFAELGEKVKNYRSTLNERKNLLESLIDEAGNAADPTVRRNAINQIRELRRDLRSANTELRSTFRNVQASSLNIRRGIDAYHTSLDEAIELNEAGLVSTKYSERLEDVISDEYARETQQVSDQALRSIDHLNQVASRFSGNTGDVTVRLERLNLVQHIEADFDALERIISSGAHVGKFTRARRQAYALVGNIKDELQAFDSAGILGPDVSNALRAAVDKLDTALRGKSFVTEPMGRQLDLLKDKLSAESSEGAGFVVRQIREGILNDDAAKEVLGNDFDRLGRLADQLSVIITAKRGNWTQDAERVANQLKDALRDIERSSNRTWAPNAQRAFENLRSHTTRIRDEANAPVEGTGILSELQMAERLFARGNPDDIENAVRILEQTSTAMDNELHLLDAELPNALNGLRKSVVKAVGRFNEIDKGIMKGQALGYSLMARQWGLAWRSPVGNHLGPEDAERFQAVWGKSLFDDLHQNMRFFEVAEKYARRNAKQQGEAISIRPRDIIDAQLKEITHMVEKVKGAYPDPAGQDAMIELLGDFIAERVRFTAMTYNKDRIGGLKEQFKSGVQEMSDDVIPPRIKQILISVQNEQQTASNILRQGQSQLDLFYARHMDDRFSDLRGENEGPWVKRRFNARVLLSYFSGKKLDKAKNAQSKEDSILPGANMVYFEDAAKFGKGGEGKSQGFFVADPKQLFIGGRTLRMVGRPFLDLPKYSYKGLRHYWQYGLFEAVFAGAYFSGISPFALPVASANIASFDFVYNLIPDGVQDFAEERGKDVLELAGQEVDRRVSTKTNPNSYTPIAAGGGPSSTGGGGSSRSGPTIAAATSSTGASSPALTKPFNNEAQQALAGDENLNKRYMKILAILAGDPANGIPGQVKALLDDEPNAAQRISGLTAEEFDALTDEEKALFSIPVHPDVLKRMAYNMAIEPKFKISGQDIKFERKKVEDLGLEYARVLKDQRKDTLILTEPLTGPLLGPLTGILSALPVTIDTVIAQEAIILEALEARKVELERKIETSDDATKKDLREALKTVKKQIKPKPDDIVSLRNDRARMIKDHLIANNPFDAITQTRKNQNYAALIGAFHAQNTVEFEDTPDLDLDNPAFMQAAQYYAEKHAADDAPALTHPQNAVYYNLARHALEVPEYYKKYDDKDLLNTLIVTATYPALEQAQARLKAAKSRHRSVKDLINDRNDPTRVQAREDENSAKKAVTAIENRLNQEVSRRYELQLLSAIFPDQSAEQIRNLSISDIQDIDDINTANVLTAFFNENKKANNPPTIDVSDAVWVNAARKLVEKGQHDNTAQIKAVYAGIIAGTNTQTPDENGDEVTPDEDGDGASPDGSTADGPDKYNKTPGESARDIANLTTSWIMGEETANDVINVAGGAFSAGGRFLWNLPKMHNGDVIMGAGGGLLMALLLTNWAKGQLPFGLGNFPGMGLIIAAAFFFVGGKGIHFLAQQPNTRTRAAGSAPFASVNAAGTTPSTTGDGDTGDNGDDDEDSSSGSGDGGRTGTPSLPDGVHSIHAAVQSEAEASLMDVSLTDEEFAIQPSDDGTKSFAPRSTRDALSQNVTRAIQAIDMDGEEKAPVVIPAVAASGIPSMEGPTLHT